MTDDNILTSAGSADLMVFVTADPIPAPLGTDEEYGRVQDFFTRTKQEVGAEIDKLVGQMQDIVERLSVRMQLFELREISFELGFSTEGRLGFIAKAGAHGTVHITFARRVETPDDHADLRMSTVGPAISRPDLLITRGWQVGSLDISRTMKWFPDRLILLTLMPRRGVSATPSPHRHMPLSGPRCRTYAQLGAAAGGPSVRKGGV
jgi:hypothetical protein